MAGNAMRSPPSGRGVEQRECAGRPDWPRAEISHGIHGRQSCGIAACQQLTVTRGAAGSVAERRLCSQVCHSHVSLRRCQCWQGV